MTTASGKFNSRYEGQRGDYVSMPMGGLGAGMLCLSGTGGLEHVTWRHKPALDGFKSLFAALSVRQPTASAKVLEGPVPGWKIFGHKRGGNGGIANNHGLPHHRHASFTNRFPFGQVELDDPAMPLASSVTGWSPFVPGDADGSSLPVAGLEYTFTNPGSEAAEAVFSFHVRNPVAYQHESNVTGEPAPSEVRRIEKGFIISQPARPGQPHEEGHAAVMVLDEADAAIDAHWFRGGWFDAMTMVWNAIESGSVLSRPAPNDGGQPSPGGSIYLPFSLEPGASKTVRVLLAWYVPYSNVHVGEPAPSCGCDGECAPDPASFYRPWYASRFASIDAVAAHWYRDYAELRRKSALFADAFFAADLPAEVLEAVSCNLSILKSPTVLRQFDGRLWGWEGCGESSGCCAGSCTHVWNYAQAICHLFPSLERSLRETEFLVSQDEQGHQNFRSWLPIRECAHKSLAACDGQLGGIIKACRDWRISGDNDWLSRLWPAIRQSMVYCIETWDPRHLGHITEPHHNTYDIEFWGPDGMCMSFYLAALQAAALMGEALSDDTALFRELLAKGVDYCDRELFNGDYYNQKIDWSESGASPIAFSEGSSVIASTYSPEARALLEKEGPKYQYGNGCLSDGILGEFLGWAAGLPAVLPEERLKSHLLAVHRYNLRSDLSDHPNPQRPGFAIGEEGGLLLCSWPHGDALSLPFVYSNEVWTGIEYQVAAHLIGLGGVEQGLEIVRACRQRYDGTRRNPYNEYECGHWYARAMSSYALMQALTGLRYDAVEKVLHLAPRLTGDFQSFLSTESGFGMAGVRDGKPFCEALHGTIEVARFEMAQ